MKALSPSPSLLCKLGSALIHARELLSPHGHAFDRVALDALMSESEVKAWLDEMDAAALLPRERVRDDHAPAATVDTQGEQHYRLLTQGDTLAADDEFLDDDCQTWLRAGEHARSFVGISYVRLFQPARRRITVTDHPQANKEG